MTAAAASARGLAGAFAALRDVLACPRCEGALSLEPPVVRCRGCGAAYPQGRDDAVRLLLPDDPAGEEWAARQAAMEAWYRDMAGSDWSRACFTNDYGPFAPLLAGYTGAVLDLGGGAGVTRHYLPACSRYVVVDPSLMWLGAEWSALADTFPCLATPPAYVQGTGEALPLRSAAFDVVLAFWTLNHAADPARVLRSVARVLRPGGVCLLVLEDMEPRWRDLPGPAGRRRGAPAVVRLAARKLLAALPGRAWALQPDHLRIRERDLRAWSAGAFAVRSRSWIGDYLAYELVARSGT